MFKIFNKCIYFQVPDLARAPDQDLAASPGLAVAPDPDPDHAASPAPGPSPAVPPAPDPDRAANLRDPRVQNHAASRRVPAAAADRPQNPSHRPPVRDPVLRPDPNPGLRRGQDQDHHKHNFVIIIFFVI